MDLMYKFHIGGQERLLLGVAVRFSFTTKLFA